MKKFSDHMIDIQHHGYTKLTSVYTNELINKIKEEFHQNHELFVNIQKKKNIYNEVKDTTHHTFILCRTMLRLLERNSLLEFLDQYFENQKFILNTMGLSMLKPNSKIYTQAIHRDVRSFTGADKLWINTLIMLDNSTKENGATWILEGSHLRSSKPSEEEFWNSAIQVEGEIGDVLIFHGNTWHCAGQNKSKSTRHIITPFFSRPFIKQQLDYPRALGLDFGNTLSDDLRQILGYNSMTPATLDEFYQTTENRFYKKDQG